MARPREWTRRFDQWVRSSPPVLLLGLLVLVLGLGVTLADGVIRAKDWYHDRYKWREDEYEKLTDLRAGLTIQLFEERLGAPVFRRDSRDGEWSEATFQGRGNSYWVQAVTRKGEEDVKLYAVTSCESDFNPNFTMPNGAPLVLNRVHLADVNVVSLGDTQSDYFAAGATANSYFFDSEYGGNPGNYKTVAWGHNDTCLDMPAWYEVMSDQGMRALGRFEAEFKGYTGDIPTPF